jgi:hypothetical protein
VSHHYRVQAAALPRLTAIGRRNSAPVANGRQAPALPAEGRIMHVSLAALAALQDRGLTAGEVLRGIPHDAPALVIYAMVVGFGFLIWKGSRQKSG